MFSEENLGAKYKKIKPIDVCEADLCVDRNNIPEYTLQQAEEM